MTASDVEAVAEASSANPTPVMMKPVRIVARTPYRAMRAGPRGATIISANAFGRTRSPASSGL